MTADFYLLAMSVRLIDSLILHHAGDPTPGKQYAKEAMFHNTGANGKTPRGQGLQYHFFIERDGLMIQAHNVNDLCFHAGDDAWSRRSVAICLAGDLTREPLTEAALSTFMRIVYELQVELGIPDERIFNHRDVRPKTPDGRMSTQCPGLDMKSIYLHRKPKYMADHLKQVENAIPRVKGNRKTMLTRLAARLRRILGLA